MGFLMRLNCLRSNDLCVEQEGIIRNGKHSNLVELLIKAFQSFYVILKYMIAVSHKSLNI